MTQQPAAYAITIGGNLYGYGETQHSARCDFGRQISGATRAHQHRMWKRSTLVPLDADAASETAECIAADPTGWV